jgi:hypothetical protein
MASNYGQLPILDRLYQITVTEELKDTGLQQFFCVTLIGLQQFIARRALFLCSKQGLPGIVPGR